MVELYESAEGIPVAVGNDLLALPGEGRVAFRLVRHDPPTSADFKPRFTKTAADVTGIAELVRLGLSHYVTLEDIRPYKTDPQSKIAAVTLSDRAYYARTGPLAGHLDVWARVEELVKSAEIVE